MSTLLVTPRTVAYAGVVTLGLKTFTTSYPTKNGAWDFAQQSLSPVEARGYISGGVPSGLYASIIDSAVAGGYTTLTIGDNANGDEDNTDFWGTNVNVGPGNLPERVSGWCLGAIAGLDIAAFDYPFALGTNSSGSFIVNSAVNLPAGSNTGIDNRMQPNMPSPGGGVVMCAEISLVDSFYIFNPVTAPATIGGYIQKISNLNLGLSNLFHIRNGLVAGGLTYMNAGNPSDQTDRTQAISTDWQSGIATQYLLTYQNPPGTLNVDSLIAQMGGSGFMLPTYGGWLYIGSTTVTVEGGTLNGWGLYVAPDFSRYYVLAFSPIDATASTWYSTAGQKFAKLDTAGRLWMKNTNSATTLYVTSGTVLRSLPIFPPYTIADRADFDPVVRMMRT